jgi:hypothetical protein
MLWGHACVAEMACVLLLISAIYLPLTALAYSPHHLMALVIGTRNWMQQ